MNTLVEIFNWSVALAIAPDDKITTARIESKHKFKQSPAAEKLAAAVVETINAHLTPETLDTMMQESKTDVTVSEQ